MALCSGYQTRQGEQILAYMSSLQGNHVTAEDIIQHFESAGVKVGRATVYRHLDKLVQNGLVRKFTFENSQSACYQYIENHESCVQHLHLKCKSCGKLFHVNSDILPAISAVLLQSENFIFDSVNTVFYGLCHDCADKTIHLPPV